MSATQATSKPAQARSLTVYLTLAVVTAGALAIGAMHGPAAADAPARSTSARPTAATSEVPVAPSGLIMDHRVIAANAVVDGDAETVERSIAAYER